MITLNQTEVPQGMVDAVQDAILYTDPNRVKIILGHALTWLANNPIVPTRDRAIEIGNRWNGIHVAGGDTGHVHYTVDMMVDWQKEMFLKRKPELPQDVKALFWNEGSIADPEDLEHNESIRRAYEIGLQAGQKVGK